jgi:uncharacterized delta-60 repeat protein
MKTTNKARALYAMLVLLLHASAKGATPGEVDLSFNPGSGVDGGLSAVARQPDGKLIIGGDFSTVRGLVRYGIARLNGDGSGDPGFDARMGKDSSVACVALQPDGRVLIGGAFTSVNGISRNGIARLNADGTLDRTFDPGLGIDGLTSPSVLALAIQPDGKLVIAGRFGSINGENRDNMARLNSDGSLDRSFNASIEGSYADVLALALQPDGKVLVAGEWATIDNEDNFSGLARLNADGSLDYAFFPDSFDVSIGYIQAIALQPDGKVLVSGGVSIFRNGDQDETGFARLNPDGSADLSFALDLGLTYPNGPVTSIALQADGKVLIAGGFSTLAGTNHLSVARLNADGSVDISFDPVVGGSLIALQPDGMVLVGNTPAIVRLNPAGGLDYSFLAEDAVTRGVYSFALQPDGKVLMGGDISTGQGTNRTAIGRLNPDGSLDLAFHAQAERSDSLGRHRGWVHLLALQPDGKVLIGGQFTSVNGEDRTNVARLNADGSVDPSFHAGLISSDLYSMALQPDGKVLIGGVGSRRIPLARFNSDGSFDGNFHSPFVILLPGGPPVVDAIALQPDGKVLISGRFAVEGSPGTTNVARLNVDGTLDTNFSVSTALGDVLYQDPGEVRSMALQPDGKVLIGGIFFSVDGASRTNLARLNADGTVDQTFTFNLALGINGVFPEVWSIALQPDGRVLLGQNAYAGPTNLLRLDVDGTMDTGFHAELGPSGNGRTVDLPALGLQPDGKLLVGGHFSFINGLARWNVARLIAGIPPQITSQPQDKSATVGEGVTFTVTVTGDPPLGYQWRKDGSNLNGATGSSLTLNNVQKTDDDLYSVLVGNPFGSVSSSNAALRIEVPQPRAMVQQLRDLVDSQVARPQPLSVSLTAALASIDRGNSTSAIGQLQAFQHKVRAQVAPLDPDLARILNQAAQAIVDRLQGGQ